jgi:hypothetical protein
MTTQRARPAQLRAATASAAQPSWFSADGHRRRHTSSVCDRNYNFLFKPDVSELILCIYFVFLASVSAPAQKPSQPNAPVKRIPPFAIHQYSPSSPPEQTLPPRFRGQHYTPRTAIVDQFSHSAVGHSAIPYAASHKLQESSNQPALTSNGFAFRPNLLAGQIPTAVATGDFNGDGKLDWAVSNGQDNSIWLYFGNGGGTAGLPTILPTAGIGPAWMIATDLNGDGKLDLVLAEVDSLTIGVFLGNGDGTFQAEARYAVPAPPLFVLAGDFTGDGKLDIAVGMAGTTATGPVAVLPGDGAGHLGAPLYTGDPNPSVGYWLAAGDLNGDGKLDLIIVDPDDIGPHGGAQAYLNNGNGTFTPGQLFYQNMLVPNLPTEFALSVAIADLNNDGCKDAAVADSFGLAEVFNGKCDGTFATPGTTYVPGDIGGAIQLVDVNGDGVPDLVVSGILLSGAGGTGLGSVAGNEVCVLLGDGTGHFGPGRTYRGDLSMYSMAVADLNGDGFPDLVTANQGSNTASVFLNDGKGGFGDPQGEAFGNDSGVTNVPDSPFVFADVDGNGTLDMVLLDRQGLPTDPTLITTLLNDGTGKFSAPIQSPIFSELPSGMVPGAFVLGNFRNTGYLDALVVAENFTSPFIVFAPGSGNGQFGQYTMTTPPGAMGPIAVGDFNGDGKLDFVAVSSAGTTTAPQQVLSVFLGQGDGTFLTGQTVAFESDNRLAAPSIVYVGDFNGDGNLDVLVWNYGLFEFLGNGDGTFQAGRVLFDTFGAFILADVNHDGLPDIIAATDALGNPYGGADAYLAIGEFSVFLGQPDGTFQHSQSYSPYLYTFYQPALYGSLVFLNPFPAVVGDFNGDGNLDVAVFPVSDTSTKSSEMQILYGNGDGTFTPSYVSYPLGKFWVPQFAADLNGDGRADIIELDNYTTSFNVIKSVTPGSTLQLEMLTTPVTGNTGYGRVILNTPASSATTVSLTASATGVSVPSLVIPSGSVSQDFQFSIGSGFNPQTVFSVQAQIGSATATAYDYVSSPDMPVIEFQPSGLIFSGIVVGATSSPQTLTLKNIGGGTLTISSGVALGLWFSDTDNCGGSLAPGASCAIQVTFTPPFIGAATDQLSVFDNVSGVSLEASLEGFGVSPLQLSPCCLAFSQVVGGTSPAQTVTLSNLGTIPIQVSSVAPSTGFSVKNGCTTIAVGGNCQISVTFTPTSGGATAGGLSLNTNVPSYPVFNVPLSGNATDFSLGSAPSVTVSPGQTATYNLSATGTDGFSGSMNLSCGRGPTGTNCKASPSSLTLGVDGSAQYSVTVTTTPNSAASVDSTASGMRARGEVLTGLLCLPLFGIVLSRRRGKKLHGIMAVVLLSCCAVVLGSCGGGGGGSGGGGGGNSGTPPGTYTLTVTGQVGSVSHTTIVTLVVQ